MSDDRVPEEEKQAYARLLSALHSSASRSNPLTTDEQEQIIARVRGRLAQTTPSSPKEKNALVSPRAIKHNIPRRRGTRLAANLLAAVVVIGLILGAWTLFRIHPSPNKTPTSSSPTAEPGPAARTQTNGLQASMHVLIGGPYFLGELLPVDVALTNDTQKSITLAGINHTANLCFDSALMVRVTAGSEPFYTFPKLETACTQPLYITTIDPGQTLTIHQYVPLTRSHAVTLTMGLSQSTPHPSDPLAGHWPSVHLLVETQAPPERQLSLSNQPGRVTIGVPAGTQPHLFFMQSIACSAFDRDTTIQWTPLTTNVLRVPNCPTRPWRWSYIVSAPGYTIISGSRSDSEIIARLDSLYQANFSRRKAWL